MIACGDLQVGVKDGTLRLKMIFAGKALFYLGVVLLSGTSSYDMYWLYFLTADFFRVYIK